MQPPQKHAHCLPSSCHMDTFAALLRWPGQDSHRWPALENRQPSTLREALCGHCSSRVDGPSPAHSKTNQTPVLLPRPPHCIRGLVPPTDMALHDHISEEPGLPPRSPTIHLHLSLPTLRPKQSAYHYCQDEQVPLTPLPLRSRPVSP